MKDEDNTDMDCSPGAAHPLHVPVPHPAAEIIDIDEFNRRLRVRLDEPVTQLIGAGPLTGVLALVGHTLCQLDPVTTIEGALTYLQRVTASTGVYALVPGTTGSVDRVVPGRKVERIPGFYLYANTAALRPTIVSPVLPQLHETDAALLVLRAVAELHRRGHQRLRVYPNVSGSGMHWRVVVVDVDEAFPSAGGENHWPRQEACHFSYSTASMSDVGGFLMDSSVSVADIADHILEQFPKNSTAGFGRDWAYVGWYSDMLESAIRHGNLPVGDGPRPDLGVIQWPFLPEAGNSIEGPPAPPTSSE